jgi:hypothetical protein
MISTTSSATGCAAAIKRRANLDKEINFLLQERSRSETIEESKGREDFRMFVQPACLLPAGSLPWQR